MKNHSKILALLTAFCWSQISISSNKSLGFWGLCAATVCSFYNACSDNEPELRRLEEKRYAHFKACFKPCNDIIQNTDLTERRNILALNDAMDKFIGEAHREEKTCPQNIRIAFWPVAWAWVMLAESYNIEISIQGFLYTYKFMPGDIKQNRAICEEREELIDRLKSNSAFFVNKNLPEDTGLIKPWVFWSGLGGLLAGVTYFNR